jgi:hypothetical protein
MFSLFWNFQLAARSRHHWLTSFHKVNPIGFGEMLIMWQDSVWIYPVGWFGVTMIPFFLLRTPSVPPPFCNCNHSPPTASSSHCVQRSTAWNLLGCSQPRVTGGSNLLRFTENLFLTTRCMIPLSLLLLSGSSKRAEVFLRIFIFSMPIFQFIFIYIASSRGKSLSLIS